MSIIGRVVATERRPSTAHEFCFCAAVDAPVGIGTIVRAESEQSVNGVIRRVYGVVVDGVGYTEFESPLHAVRGSDGELISGATDPSGRPEIRLYTAAVLRQKPEEPMQPVGMGTVHLGTDDDVATALRMDTYLENGANSAIPVGLYGAGASASPVYLDADFLLGPEAAHLNISGVSGLATKTSAIEWLLASIFEHFPASKGRVAAVCFNVKGPDLCFLDQPTRRLEEADRELYARLRVPAEPFQDVEYFAPYTARGYTLNTLRSNEALGHNVKPLTWGLREVMQYAEVLFNQDDIDAKADALIDFIKERVIDQLFTDEKFLVAPHRVQSFSELERWFRELLAGMEKHNAESWRTHHGATIRKVRNRLTNISTRCRGLVTDDGTVSDLPFGAFRDRSVLVVDVANLEADAQDLIFTRVVSQLREHLERRTLGVEHVVVFVDELNKYAPAEGPDTYVRTMLLDIAERGRYLGLVLFAAQQFRSQVHRRVVGNCATALFGRMDADELNTPGYATLSSAIRGRLSSLGKGELMVRHPHFTQPVFVRFPRPAVLSGREGVEQYPQAAEPALGAAVTRSLRTLDRSVTLEWVNEAIAQVVEEEVLRARNRTLQARPEDVRAFFRAQFKRRIRTETIPAPPRTPLRATAPDDPYSL